MGAKIAMATTEKIAAIKVSDTLTSNALLPPPRAGGYPVTNIRNTLSPHWRAWRKPENRCLGPFNGAGKSNR